MRAIMVMYDSLNRRYLPPYGCDWVKMPNFTRLAEKSAMFMNNYVGSMPCMPARREIHTGRYNFLHCGWGPMEPYDDSMPQILHENGVYSHLCSDHYHYWEDGGCTYHNRYASWQMSRGQEGDQWMGQVKNPDLKFARSKPVNVDELPLVNHDRQDAVNRQFMSTIETHPQHLTFKDGMDFIERNKNDDRWFLQIETFDPHEPYFSNEKYHALYEDNYDGPEFDWPPYEKVSQSPEMVDHVKKRSAALHSMCDEYLGKVLDMMDAHDMWKDTMLIVNTDHGYLMSEHDYWGKSHCPYYNEVAHSPLFIWDPRLGVKGQKRQSLTQTIDLAPTVLEFFDLPIPADMTGKPLRDVIESDTPIRQAGLFGMFGSQINVTDGRYVYMRAPESDTNTPLNQYTLMPTHMRKMYSVEEMRTATMHSEFVFTKGCPVMKIDGSDGLEVKMQLDRTHERNQNLLFDLQSDPEQKHPITDAAVEQRMIELMIKLMKEHDAPVDQYERMGLNTNGC